MALEDQTDELLTLEQIEQSYGVKRSTLYRCIQKGYLTAYRRLMDKRVYFRRGDVEALRRFKPAGSRSGPTLAGVQRAREFQRRVFGGRQLAVPSADLIEESRRERADELP